MWLKRKRKRRSRSSEKRSDMLVSNKKFKRCSETERGREREIAKLIIEEN